MLTTQELFAEFQRKAQAACDLHSQGEIDNESFDNACEANKRIRECICHCIRKIDRSLPDDID